MLILIVLCSTYCFILSDMKFYFYFFWSQGWAAVCCTHAHVCEFWAFWAEQLANWRWFLREWVTFNLASSPFLSSLISIDSGPSRDRIFAQHLLIIFVLFLLRRTHDPDRIIDSISSSMFFNTLQHNERAKHTSAFPLGTDLRDSSSLNFKSFIHELTAIQTLFCENFLHLSIVFVF